MRHTGNQSDVFTEIYLFLQFLANFGIFFENSSICIYEDKIDNKYILVIYHVSVNLLHRVNTHTHDKNGVACHV